jgi:hypothetical protein
MPLKKTGVALRPLVTPPSEIVKLAKVIDQSEISHLFIPDIPFGFDSLEISSACLGVTKGLRIGSGVFRLLDQDKRQLLRRLETLQSLSENRYLFGVGVGDPSSKPEQKIKDFMQRLQEIKSEFPKRDGLTFPESFIATLKIGIAKKSAGNSDGILLNFCSPKYAGELAQNVIASFKGNLEIGCYLKTFFSKSKETATRLAIEEFAKYNSMGQYHKMFERDGVSELITSAARSLENHTIEFPDRLREISPVNPDQNEISDYISRYREAGVTIPCVYPYFASGETFEFKLETIHKIIASTQ